MVHLEAFRWHKQSGEKGMKALNISVSGHMLLGVCSDGRCIGRVHARDAQLSLASTSTSLAGQTSGENILTHFYKGSNIRIVYT